MTETQVPKHLSQVWVSNYCLIIDLIRSESSTKFTENHLIACESASFVTKYVFDLAKLFIKVASLDYRVLNFFSLLVDHIIVPFHEHTLKVFWKL